MGGARQRPVDVGQTGEPGGGPLSGEPGCQWLEDAKLARPAIVLAMIEPVPVGEPGAAPDRYTYQTFTAGRVRLPGRSVRELALTGPR